MVQATAPRIRRVRPGATRDKAVRVAITVSAVVVDGDVAPEDFVRWLQQAVDHYHTFRAGCISVGGEHAPLGGLQRPVVAQVGSL